MNKRLMAGLGLAALIGTAAIGAGSAFARAEAARPDGPRQERMGAEAGRMMDPARMADRCTDRFARENARLTYMATKLDLTDAQKPLWQAYADAVTKGNAADRDSCLEKVKAMPAPEAGSKEAGQPRQRPSAVEREAMRIERLEAELTQAKATAPALTKLYGALDADQQKILDKPAQGRHGHRHGMTRARFDRGDDCRPDVQRHGFGQPDGMPRGDQPPPPRG